MLETVNASVKEIVKGLNIFKFFQLMWIFTINFFVINSFIGFFSDIDGLEVEHLPYQLEFKKYNNEIMSFFKTNSEALLGLSIILIFSGIIVWLVVEAIFSKYKFIRTYAPIGIYAGSWIFVCAVTYWLYSLTGKYFVTFLFIASYIILYFKTSERFYKIRQFFSPQY